MTRKHKYKDNRETERANISVQKAIQRCQVNVPRHVNSVKLYQIKCHRVSVKSQTSWVDENQSWMWPVGRVAFCFEGISCKDATMCVSPRTGTFPNQRAKLWPEDQTHFLRLQDGLISSYPACNLLWTHFTTWCNRQREDKPLFFRTLDIFWGWLTLSRHLLHSLTTYKEHRY